MLRKKCFARPISFFLGLALVHMTTFVIFDMGAVVSSPTDWKLLLLFVSNIAFT